MPRRRSPKLATRVLFIDGEPFVIGELTRNGLVARRLIGRERDLVVKQFDDLHAEVAARRPLTRR